MEWIPRAQSSSNNGQAQAQTKGQDQNEFPPYPSFIIVVLAAILLGVFILFNIPPLLARVISTKRGEQSLAGYRLSSRPPRHTSQSSTGNPPPRKYPVYWPRPSTIFPSPITGLWGIGIPYAHQTIGQAFVCLCWTALLSLGLFYTNNVVSNPVRAGYLAVWQLPVVFALGHKVNIIGYLVGKGYEKLNHLHRFVGRALFVAATFHGIGYLTQWTRAGKVSQEAAQPSNIAGLTAWSAFTFIGLTSLRPVRARLYGFFWISHWVGFVVALIALGFHQPYTAAFSVAAGILYFKDILLRLLTKTRISTARLVPLTLANGETNSDGTVGIFVPLKSGWRAGQHVFIRIPALRKNGGMAWLENHPFTIASAPSLMTGSRSGKGSPIVYNEENEPVLLVKKLGDWSRSLYDFATEGNQAGVDREKGLGAVVGKECKVLLEGPYGGPGPIMFASYSGVMLIAGGSGISFTLSIFEDLVNKAERGHVRATTLDFVWIKKNSNESASLSLKIQSLLRRAEKISLKTRVSIYHTRQASFISSSAPFDHTRQAASTSSSSPAINPHIPAPSAETLVNQLDDSHIVFKDGRPALDELVDDAVQRTRMEVSSGRTGRCGMMVAVCGPGLLVEQTKKAVRSMPRAQQNDIGGIAIHTESFGW